MLLTSHQVAAQLQCSVDTVLRHVQAGTLPVIRLSKRRFRFEPADVEAFLAARKSNRSPSAASTPRR